MKVLVGKSPATDFKTLSQECGLQCETNGNYNKYKHWKHDSEASLKPPSRFRVAAVQSWLKIPKIPGCLRIRSVWPKLRQKFYFDSKHQMKVSKLRGNRPWMME